jgi:hypothetical protein
LKTPQKLLMYETRLRDTKGERFPVRLF